MRVRVYVQMLHTDTNITYVDTQTWEHTCKPKYYKHAIALTLRGFDFFCAKAGSIPASGTCQPLDGEPAISAASLPLTFEPAPPGLDPLDADDDLLDAASDLDGVSGPLAAACPALVPGSDLGVFCPASPPLDDCFPALSVPLLGVSAALDDDDVPLDLAGLELLSVTRRHSVPSSRMEYFSSHCNKAWISVCNTLAFCFGFDLVLGPTC